MTSDEAKVAAFRASCVQVATALRTLVKAYEAYFVAPLPIQKGAVEPGEDAMLEKEGTS